MSSSRLASAARSGAWVLAAALAVGLWSHRSALERANHRLDDLAPLAERAAVRDGLIGTDLSALRFARVEGGGDATPSDRGRTLVWVVDPRECAGCLSDLSGWRRLTDSPLSVITVLANVSRRQAAEIRRQVALPGQVAVDPGGEVAASLGLSPTLPSLYVLLDASGTVLMSEARQASPSCGWSFTAQVADLLPGPGRAAPRRAAGP